MSVLRKPLYRQGDMQQEFGSNDIVDVNGIKLGNTPGVSPIPGALHYDGNRIKSITSSSDIKTIGPRAFTVIVAADGTGDFTTIADGINNVGIYGGTNRGIVFIREGIYTISSQLEIHYPNISLIGCGYSTIIKQADGVNLDQMLWISNVDVADKIRIQDLCFDGNKVNQTAGTGLGISINGIHNVWIDGVFFRNTRDDAISTTAYEVKHLRVRNCNFRDNGGSGIALTLAEGAVIRDCFFDDNAGTTIWVGTGSRIEVSSCYVVGSSSSGIYFQTDVKYSRVVNNTISWNGSRGIREAGTSNYNIYMMNTLHDNTGVDIETVGANNIIGSNIIV